MPYPRPPRLILTNLDQPDTTKKATLEAQFNPTELQLAIKAIYGSKGIIPGMSHTQRQFSHTDDLTLNFELTFRVSDPKPLVMRNGIYTEAGVFGSDSSIERFTLQDRAHAEQFLLSLCVPRGAELISRNSPPPVLVVWPGFLAFESIVLGVDFKYTRFNAKALPVEMTANVQMEELRELRYTSQDALEFGFQRYGRSTVGS